MEKLPKAEAHDEALKVNQEIGWREGLLRDIKGENQSHEMYMIQVAAERKNAEIDFAEKKIRELKGTRTEKEKKEKMEDRLKLIGHKFDRIVGEKILEEKLNREIGFFYTNSSLAKEPSSENLDNLPEEMRDGKKYFFFGSKPISYATWRDDKWTLGYPEVDDIWQDDDRILLNEDWEINGPTY